MTASSADRSYFSAGTRPALDSMSTYAGLAPNSVTSAFCAISHSTPGPGYAGFPS